MATDMQLFQCFLSRLHTANNHTIKVKEQPNMILKVYDM